ncbi:MAG: GNAT family N-acetyltransferase [Myxococcales bacterium]|jgi:GNAT superfamily N-acetyltransferase
MGQRWCIKKTATRLKVRPPKPAEMEQVFAMMEDFNRLEGIPWERGRTMRAVRRLLLDRSLGWLVVFETAGVLAGYAVVTYGFDLEFGGRDAFITELYLRPELRGQGLGGEAMGQLEKRAARDAVRALHLLVDWRNLPARRLYTRRGFALSHRRMMTKPLP